MNDTTVPLAGGSPPPRYEAPLWRWVDDWPAVPGYLRQTLDADLIPKHATAVLRRALDFDSVIGFVGSGVSMSYGRLAWGELIKWIAESARRSETWSVASRGPIDALRDKPSSPRLTSTQVQLTRLLDDLQIGNPDRKLGIQSVRYPAAFQFLEQWSLEMRGAGSLDRRESRVRRSLRAMLRDDAGHAYLLLERLLTDLARPRACGAYADAWAMREARDPLNPEGPSDAKEQLDLAKPLDPLRHSWASVHNYVVQSLDPESVAWRERSHADDPDGWHNAFRVSATRFDKLRLRLTRGSIARDLVGDVRDALMGRGKQADPDHTVLLAPLHRFVVTALVRLDPATVSQCLWSAGATPAPESAPRRGESIPEGRDALLMLLRDFGLRRFVTTNYDLDIEHAIVDLGFDHTTTEPAWQVRQFTKVPGLARNALGLTAHTGVFRYSHASDLLRFAGSRSTAIQVVHLHGRVLPGEPLVVTEHDYQSMYLRQTGAADAARDAIGLALRSNTVLFVGNGMGEDDILRPMRQFVKERKSSADRSGIVLLPASKDRAQEVEEAIGLYSRYGVLTKHYGVGTSANGSTDAGDNVRWLEGWSTLCNRVETAVAALVAALDRGDFSTKTHDAIRRQMGEPLTSSKQPVDPLHPHAINGVAIDDLVKSLGLGNGFAELPEIALGRAVALHAARLVWSIGQSEQEWPSWLKYLGHPRGEGLKPVPEITTTGPIAPVRLAECLRAMAVGLGGAVQSLAMVLELASLHRDWLRWKKERMFSPLIRPVGAPRHESGTQLAGLGAPVVIARNRLALRSVSTNVERAHGLRSVPTTDRFMLEAPSHSFACFVDAMRNPAEPAQKLVAGSVGARRIYLLVGRRGLGKGHFFEMLTEEARIADFIRSSWAGETPPSYAVTCYVNLGTSLEFLSAFDRLSLALVNVADDIFAKGNPATTQIRDASQRLAKNRLARLQAVLRIYADNKCQKRMLIAFNGFSHFFDRHGAPKNAQLYRLIDALLGDASAAVPIDVLLISQESDTPGLFRVGGLSMPIEANRSLDGWSHVKHAPLRLLVEPGADERLLRKLAQTIEATGILAGDVGSRAPSRRRDQAFVHVLRGAHASATVGKYFPEVALSIAFESQRKTVCIDCKPSDVRKLQDVTIAIVHKYEVGGKRVAIDAFALALLASVRQSDTKTSVTLSQLFGAAEGESMEAAIERRVNKIAEQVIKRAQGTDDRGSEDASAEDAIDAGFQRLHKALRANRYLLSIACAAAAERGWVTGEKGESKFDPQRVYGWFESIRLDAANHLADDAVDRIIEKVLVSHQQAHEQGKWPAAWTLDETPAKCDSPHEKLERALGELRSLLVKQRKCTLPEPSNESLSRALCGPLAWRLQQRLLWHLAVMALEVQADVLATAPLVEADCAELVAGALGLESGRLRIDDLRRLRICRALVELMLDLLVHRCLAFRMEPVELGSEDVRPLQVGRERRSTGGAAGQGTVSAPDSGWRFSVHRFLQRSILRQLKAPFIEYPKVDQFGLSMWATQPDELPRPDRSAAHDIAGLVAAWIGFPSSTDSMRETTAFHWFLHAARCAQEELVKPTSTWARTPPHDDLWREVTLPARMLRAALGVLRATYSVGVVSRFHDFDSEEASLRGPEEGYFRQHHQQVRWLLDQAKQLGTEKKGLAELLEKSREDNRLAWWGIAMEAVAPFFVDELVWLNNECGLFCLVEGRLDNAAGMFRQALVMAEEVEGRDPHGALWCRIHLNLAIVDIERGRIREADERLAAIESIRDENPILRVLARGFRALVEHVSGNLRRAEEVYRRVIKDLVTLGQLRAVAIFSRHLAELYRLQGANAAVQAYAAIEQSIAAATKGGHEDIRHLAMLSRVRLAIAGVLPAEVLARERDTIQEDLAAIEHYGTVMGMPRILADVSFAKALHLLNWGELRQAAGLASHCLGLCAANGLRLRQMMAMALLGSIYRKRGLLPLAEPLMAQAYAMAVDSHYGNLREASLTSRQGELSELD